MAPILARRILVHGLVQGVFFRAATRDVADRHGVSGWVANRSDGTVEAWLEGPAEAVAAVEAWIDAGGPPAARVTHVDADVMQPTGAVGFELRAG